MATKTRNPQTSTIHPGNPRIPEALHPRVCPHRPTAHQPPEKGSRLPMDGRAYPSSGQTNRYYPKRPRPLPTRPLKTIHPRSRCLRIRHRSNTVPRARRNEVKKTGGIPFPDLQPCRTKLRHLRPRIPGHHPRPRKLETSSCRKPPPGDRPHGPQQPPILATSTTNQQAHRPLPLTISGLRRPPKTPTRSNEQGRPPLPTTRLRPRDRRQPGNHRSPRQTVRKRSKPGNPPGRRPPIPAGPRTHPTRVGKQTPTHQNTRRMVQRPQTRCRGRQRPKEGGNAPHSRRGHRRTPRNSQNPRPTKQKLLVAGRKKLRNRIRKRVRSMPVTKKHHHPTKTPPIPHFHRSRGSAFRVHSPRLHHQITPVRRLRLHTDDNRPRLLERIHIHPMQRNDRRHRGRRTLWQTRLPPLRSPTEGHFQPRPPIHRYRNERTMQELKHQTKHQYRLPPPDGRTI